MASLRDAVTVRGMQAVFCGLMLSALPIHGQSSSGAQMPTFKAETREVSVVFRVVDKQGQSVGDITPKEIRIDDEGISRTITSFAGNVAHAQVVVVADVSGSMGTVIEPLQGALFTFADLVSKDYEHEPGDVLLSLVPFSETATMLVDRTANPAEFKRAAERLEPSGTTALVDTILSTLLNAFGEKSASPAPVRQVRRSDNADDTSPIPSEFRPRRAPSNATIDGTKRSKFLVLLTDAGENASGHQWSDIASAMLGKDVVIYSIEFNSGTPDANLSMLSKVTRQSGGKVYPARAEDLQRVYSQIAHDIRSHYQLTFAAGELANPRKWRNIRVTTTRPNVTLFARTGYCPETPCQKEDGSFVGGRPKSWPEVLALSRDPGVIFTIKEHLRDLKFDYSPETEKIVRDLAQEPLLVEKVWSDNAKKKSESSKYALVDHKVGEGNQQVSIDAEVCGIKLDSETGNSLQPKAGTDASASFSSEPGFRVLDPEIRLARKPGTKAANAETGDDAYFQSQAIFYLRDPSGRIPSRIRVQCNRPHYLIGDDLVRFAVQAVEHGLKVKSQTGQRAESKLESRTSL